MGENTRIEWAHHTFNPWMGCERISPACDHCYAADYAKRIGRAELWEGERRRTGESNWKQPLKWDAAARAAGARVRVFCASLADVFDNAVPLQWRVDLFELIGKTTNIDWLLLTKRIGNAHRMLDEVMDVLSHGLQRWDEPMPWPNVWIGATVCNQTEADRDIPKLLATPARVRFLSCEPLLGPVDLRFRDWPGPDGRPVGSRLCVCYPRCRCGLDARRGIDWVIAGGESGPRARPAHPDWFRGLRDQCGAAGVPFLFKQWGEWVPRGLEQTDCPLIDDVPRIRLTDAGGNGSVLGAEGGNDCWMQRAGKKRAGRTLDGVVHDGFPGGQS